MKPAVVRCMVCGYRLTNPESVKREIGPVCWKRLKLIQKLDEYRGLDSGEECPVMVPEMEEPEPTLPICPSCGKQSPNPHYCIQCGSPIKKALEVLA